MLQIPSHAERIVKCAVRLWYMPLVHHCMQHYVAHSCGNLYAEKQHSNAAKGPVISLFLTVYTQLY